MSPEERIKLAIKTLMNYGGVDGAHHKQFALDQTLRILTGSQNETVESIDKHGVKYSYEILGESKEYRQVVAEYCNEDANGNREYEWDVGIPP